MAQVFIVERHWALVNGSTASQTLQAFTTRVLAERFAAEQKLLIAELLGRETVSRDPQGQPELGDSVGGTLASLGLESIRFKIGITELRETEVVAPAPPSIVLARH
jgi:hypothetical protein